MISLSTNYPQILNELEDVLRLFFPTYKRLNQDKNPNEKTIFSEEFFVSCNKDNYQEPIKIFLNNVEIFSSTFNTNFTPKIRAENKQFEWEVKKTLYKALSATYKAQMPFGCLTGVRPTKLATALLRTGISRNNLQSILENVYLISSEKIDLILGITDVQLPLISTDSSEVDLYVNIPFCPSRCNYCSFITIDHKRNAPLLDDYLKSLFFEIAETLKMMEETGKRIRSVYVGGGTPTVLSADQLAALTDILPAAPEFTIEGGRPETITQEKLAAIRHKCGRISINPQTLEDNVLRAIGRAHSVEDIYLAYSMAREQGFDINMDIIAGLSTDSLAGFMRTVDGVLALAPHNITVHTLSIKRTSTMDKSTLQEGSEVGKMLSYAHKAICKGYNAYYMYRQKYQSQNLENTGYSLAGHECLYNIDTMEENVSVLACGAGAISKIFYPDQNRLERQANPKNLKDYLTKLPTLLSLRRTLLT